MLKQSRIPTSWLISFVLALAIAIFLVTAEVTNINTANTPRTETTDQPAAGQELPTVVATYIKPRVIARTLTVYGRTSPNRVITLRSEIPARVKTVNARRGEMLEPGQDIIQLREGSLPTELEHARAQLKQAQQEYESSLALHEKNHLADNRLNELEVAVAQARSNLRQLEIEQQNTRIQSPVTGILNNRFVEKGDFLDKGREIAEILDLDPLIIDVDVPQNTVALFAEGSTATVRLENRPPTAARIRFIDREANEATRTFTVELALPNPGMTIPAGLSAEAELHIDRTEAVAVSPAYLSLSDKGELGIKWLDSDNRVHFTVAEIVKTETSQLWLAGLPGHARIITLGHGFVRPGDQVQVAADNDPLLAGD